MKTRSMAVAAGVALAVAVGLPAFNWAQDATSDSGSDDVQAQSEWSEPQERPDRPERGTAGEN